MEIEDWKSVDSYFESESLVMKYKVELVDGVEYLKIRYVTRSGIVMASKEYPIKEIDLLRSLLAESGNESIYTQSDMDKVLAELNDLKENVKNISLLAKGFDVEHGAVGYDPMHMETRHSLLLMPSDGAFRVISAVADTKRNGAIILVAASDGMRRR